MIIEIEVLDYKLDILGMFETLTIRDYSNKKVTVTSKLLANAIKNKSVKCKGLKVDNYGFLYCTDSFKVCTTRRTKLQNPYEKNTSISKSQLEAKKEHNKKIQRLKKQKKEAKKKKQIEQIKAEKKQKKLENKQLKLQESIQKKEASLRERAVAFNQKKAEYNEIKAVEEKVKENNKKQRQLQRRVESLAKSKEAMQNRIQELENKDRRTPDELDELIKLKRENLKRNNMSTEYVRDYGNANYYGHKKLNRSQYKEFVNDNFDINKTITGKKI